MVDIHKQIMVNYILKILWFIKTRLGGLSQVVMVLGYNCFFCIT